MGRRRKPRTGPGAGSWGVTSRLSATGNSLPATPVPSKPALASSNDILEKQADQAVEAVERSTPLAIQSRPASENFSNHRPDNIKLTPAMRQALASRSQRLDADTRRRLRPYFGAHVNRVRVHTDAQADRSARIVNARAYTVGSKIVFRQGQYAPHTQAGRRLLTHEMSHVARPQPNTIMRSAFDSEDPALRIRRFAAIRKARVVISRLVGALSRGYIWRVESVGSGGIYLRHMGVVESVARREARLRNLIGAMILLVRELETAPIPSAWLAPSVSAQTGTLTAGSARDPALTDLLMFYAHRGSQMGRSNDLLYNNIAYIMDAPGTTRAVSRAAISRGIATGIYIHVPDPENEPMVYRRLTGRGGWPQSGVSLDVMHDSFGYYYVYRGRKHYLPARP